MIKKALFILLLCCPVYFGVFYLLSSWKDIFSKKYYEVIKFDTITSSNLVVPVVIGGKTYNFDFDTGGSTSISKALFAELKLAIVDSTESIDYYSNPKRVYRCVLPDLAIGKTQFSNVKVDIIRPIQSFSPCGIKIDGYLGDDVLSKGIVQIDMRKHQLVIANSIKSIDVAGHNSIDFEVSPQMIPLLLIQFPGLNASERVLFDTGSAKYFYRLRKDNFLKMVKNEYLKKKDILDTLGLSANGSGLFGKQKEKEIFYVNFDSISFVGKTMYNCPAYTFSTENCSIIGSPFLQLGIVTLDYRHQKFYFKSYRDGSIDLSPMDGFTMTSNAKSQLIVQTVLIGSLAEHKGIRKDFILKKLNAIYFDSLSICELMKLDWSTEIHRKNVEYLFLTKENTYLNVQIKNE